MKQMSVAILMLLLVGGVGDVLAENRPFDREPLQWKRRVAPIRGRRVAPSRATERDHEHGESKAERLERSGRYERSGGKPEGQDDDDGLYGD